MSSLFFATWCGWRSCSSSLCPWRGFWRRRCRCARNNSPKTMSWSRHYCAGLLWSTWSQDRERETTTNPSMIRFTTRTNTQQRFGPPHINYIIVSTMSLYIYIYIYVYIHILKVGASSFVWNCRNCWFLRLHFPWEPPRNKTTYTWGFLGPPSIRSMFKL